MRQVINGDDDDDDGGSDGGDMGVPQLKNNFETCYLVHIYTYT